MKFNKILQNINKNHRLGILVFCDPGMDDALMLWQLMSNNQYEILGIIASAGNAPRSQTINNALQIVSLANRHDIKVFPGCLSPENQLAVEMLTGVAVYGDDDLGGVELPATQQLAELQDGVDFAAQIIQERSILIVSTADLTDIYRVLDKLQQTSSDKLKNILGISMMAGVINPTQEANVPIKEVRQSEFNILFDVFASQQVFAITEKYAIPIFLAPLDLTHSLLCSQQDALAIKKSPNLVAAKFYEFLEKVPLHYQKRYRKGPDGTYRQPLHDLHASNCLLHPDLYHSSLYTITVLEDGTLETQLNPLGNVHLLQLPYAHRKTFFQKLIQDLRCYNELTFQLQKVNISDIKLHAIIISLSELEILTYKNSSKFSQRQDSTDSIARQSLLLGQVGIFGISQDLIPSNPQISSSVSLGFRK